MPEEANERLEEEAEAKKATPEELERERMIARLEELGPDRVRSLAAAEGFPHTWFHGVHAWLAEKAREARGESPKEAKPKAP